MDLPATEMLSGYASRLAGEDTPAGFPLNSTSPKLESFRVVKAGAAVLFGFSGFNSLASAQFIQVHDSTDALANGHVPVVVISAPASSNFSADFGNLGRAFRGGIIITNSSTLATLTAGAADCWFDAQYG